MCGLVGVLNLDERPVLLSDIKKMAEKIAHRGPDGEGYFVKGNIAFAHKRLAILDPKPRGKHPMESKDGNWVIIFNGCVYNFLELKQDLKTKDHEFITNTDTEVIVEGLAEYGTEFFKRLNGMFAIGAWNKSEKNLYLSRDRFGVKPLYYFFNNKSFVFASEVKAILAHPEYCIALNYDSLNEYFTFQNLFTYQTLFKGIYLFPQANTLKINSETTTIQYNS